MMMIMVVAIGMVRLLFLLFSCDDSCGRGVAHVGVSAAYRSRQAVSMCVWMFGVYCGTSSGIAGEELVVVGIFCVLFPFASHHHTIITITIVI